MSALLYLLGNNANPEEGSLFPKSGKEGRLDLYPRILLLLFIIYWRKQRMSIGIWQILIVLVIVLVLFGHNRLPEIGGGLGKAARNFKKGLTEPDEVDITDKTKDEQTKKS